jgi:ArsR family transcriptional regulator, virulence genes transcriptional regulator
MKQDTALKRTTGRGSQPAAAGPMQAHAGNAARMLKALANESRLMILCLLVEQERSVSELNALLPLSQSALSQHLSVLREDGLVTTRRQAQAIIYGIAESPARQIIGTLHDVYCGKGSGTPPAGRAPRRNRALSPG